MTCGHARSNQLKGLAMQKFTQILNKYWQHTYNIITKHAHFIILIICSNRVASLYWTIIFSLCLLSRYSYGYEYINSMNDKAHLFWKYNLKENGDVSLVNVTEPKVRNYYLLYLLNCHLNMLVFSVLFRYLSWFHSIFG